MRPLPYRLGGLRAERIRLRRAADRADAPVRFFRIPTWQLVINTGTTIVTFLMVFLIQNTQNRAPPVTTITS
jgi:hypothetical protein